MLIVVTLCQSHQIVKKRAAQEEPGGGGWAEGRRDIRGLGWDPAGSCGFARLGARHSRLEAQTAPASLLKFIESARKTFKACK